jgi:hypothetical protein
MFPRLLYGKSVDEDLLMLTPFATQVTLKLFEFPQLNQLWNFIPANLE